MPSENGCGGPGPLGIGHCPHCSWQEVTLPGQDAAVWREARALRLMKPEKLTHSAVGGEHPTLGTWIQSALSPEPRTLSPLRNDVHLSCLVSPLHGFRKRRKWHAKSIWLLSFLFLDGENRLMYQASQLHHPASEMNSASFVSFFFLNLFWITLNQSLVHFPYRVFVFVLFWWGRTTQ